MICLVDEDISRTQVVLGAGATRVEHAAARLLADEIAERAGVRLPVLELAPGALSAPVQILLGAPETHCLVQQANLTALDSLGPDGMVLESRTVDQVTRVFGAARTARGVLYAADEILDRLVYEPGRVILPPVTYRHTPAFPVRGAIEHLVGLYDEATGMRNSYSRLLCYLARRRANTLSLSVDTPGGNSLLVGYRYFPALYDATGEVGRERARERARQAVDAAAEYGIDTYLATAELCYPAALPDLYPDAVATAPEGGEVFYDPPQRKPVARLCFAHPAVRDWYSAKIRELFEHVPAAVGLELRVAWAGSDVDIFYCSCAHCQRRSPTERLLDLIAVTLEALDSAAPGQAKQVLLRTYLGAWRQVLESDYYLPLAGQLDPRVIVLNKAQIGDMYYCHPAHPLTGRFAPVNAEGVEFELAGEYRAGLQWAVPVPITPLLRDRVPFCHARGVTQLFARNVHFHNDLSTPDIDVFFGLAWDLGASPAQLWQEWGRRNYGPAGPQVVELLDGMNRVMQKALYVQGVNFTSYALFAESLVRLRHLVVDRSARSLPGGLARITPTRANIALILAEKEEAIALSGWLLERLAILVDDLPSRSQQALANSLHLLHELALAYRALAEAFWRYLRWEHTLSEVDRRFQSRDVLAAVAQLRSAARRLRDVLPCYWNAEALAALGTDPALVDASRLNLGAPSSALERIALDIERGLDVPPASMWGYYPRLAEERWTG